MRRLSEKLATLQSRLMTDDNHPIDNITSGAKSVRRKSAFTLPSKETGSDLNPKRHSLQLPPTQSPNCRRDDNKSASQCTTNLMPGLNEVHDASFPQELNPASALLHSVSVHSAKLSQQNLKSVSLNSWPCTSTSAQVPRKENKTLNHYT